MRKLIIEEMRRDIPAGSLDKSIRFHSSSTALWNKGDIDLSSIDWEKKTWIFLEAKQDREDDEAYIASHSTG